MADHRPKRRCVTSKQAVPSAIHYVGYVEDDETPEMIMKKFEELQRIQVAAAAKKQLQGQQHAEREADREGGPTDCSAGPRTQEAQEAGTSSAGAAAVDNPALDEDALLEVFKQTSIFNVRSALANNEVLLAADTHPDAMGAMSDDARYRSLVLSDGGSDLDQGQLAYLGGFWSDGDLMEGRLPGGRHQRRRRAKGEPKPPREPKAPRERKEKKPKAAGHGKQRHLQQQLLTQYHTSRGLHAALIRRKVKMGAAAAGRGVLMQLRVPPPPLPLAWGRTVQPYAPPLQPPKPAAAGACGSQGPEDSVLFAAKDIAAFQWQALLSGKSYQAVMINSGWELEPGQEPAMGPTAGAAAAAQAAVAPPGQQDVMARFRALPLPQLCPKGFVMAWVHKGLIPLVCRQLAAWGYSYVENLTWVVMDPNNTIGRSACKPAPVRRSHRTLLIFRKDGEGRDIELRHQRSPDVVFEAERSVAGRAWGVPREVYTTIETMLPTGKGLFLELWAQADVRRPGWDHIVELPA